MERNGQLAGPEVGAEVAADLADHVDDQLAHLLGERLKLIVAEPGQVLWAVDSIEQRLVARFSLSLSLMCGAYG